MADVVVDKPETGLTGLLPKTEKFGDDTDLMNDILGPSDKPDKPKKEEKEEEDKEEDKEELLEEEPELEPELEEKEDDLLPEVQNNRNLDFAKIKEKYPDFAKTNEYKQLRDSYYREGQLSEVFPTVEDAREAAENNETFVKLNDALINKSDPLILLNAIKEANPDAAKKIATNFLPSIEKFDKNLYVEVITPVVKQIARQLHSIGQSYKRRDPNSENGEALIVTAKNIMLHYFEDPDLVDKEDPKIDPRIAEKEKELSEREQRIAQDKLESALNLTFNSAEKHLDNLIAEGLDPDNKLNEFTKEALVDKIKNSVKKQLEADQSHVKRMTSLWNRAGQNGYDRNSLSSILSAYLERAKQIIPSERTKFRSKALGRQATKEQEDNVVRMPSSGRTNRPAQQADVRKVDPKKINYRETSDLDIMEGKVKLR